MPNRAKNVEEEKKKEEEEKGQWEREREGGEQDNECGLISCVHVLVTHVTGVRQSWDEQGPVIWPASGRREYIPVLWKFLLSTRFMCKRREQKKENLSKQFPLLFLFLPTHQFFLTSHFRFDTIYCCQLIFHFVSYPRFFPSSFPRPFPRFFPSFLSKFLPQFELKASTFKFSRHSRWRSGVGKPV